MIEINNITKRFGNHTALENLSLKFGETEVVVVAGPSGAGKTTLLRLIAGLETPDSGSILIKGKEASTKGRVILPPHQRNLGMVFQGLALWPHMTVLKNLEYGLKSHYSSRSERLEKVEDILHQVGLDGSLQRYSSSLSEGEKQRVALARAMVTEPQILLMDEPLSNIDTVLKPKLLKLILDMVRKNKTLLIYVTHDHEDTLFLAEKIVIIVNGRLEYSGNINLVETNQKSEFLKKFHGCLIGKKSPTKSIYADR